MTTRSNEIPGSQSNDRHTDAEEAERRRLFVVKAKEKSSTGFETFLKNRGWDVTATCDLKEALAGLFNQPVHCVLVTVEHSNPKCLRLPTVIAQTLKVPVILFCEGLTPNGMSALRATGHPYTLGPTLSGPAIERMILKIERDQKAKGTEDESGNFKFGAKGQTMEDIVHLFEGDGLAPMKSAEAGIGFRSQPGEEESNSFRSTGSNTMEGAGLGSAGGSGAISSEGGLSLTDLADILHEPSSNELRYTEQHSAKPKLSPGDSAALLVRGVEHALSISSVQITATCDPHGPAPIHQCARVACFYVTSSNFKGSLVVAFGTGRDVDLDFVANIKTFFTGYMHKQGIATDFSELPDFRLNEVSFENWSLEHAMFLRKSVHYDQEIAVSFFPHQDETSPLELSAEAHMSKMKLDEIRHDVNLEFDIYLHFPINKKYIRYAAKGRNMMSEQRSRISAGGITHVHIRKECEKDVVRYKVQNFLNDKIKEYISGEAS